MPIRVYRAVLRHRHDLTRVERFDFEATEPNDASYQAHIQLTKLHPVDHADWYVASTQPKIRVKYSNKL